ncbi:sulfite exporter TauE/SafE family protein [Aetokthonos hydrillicola CCALA 1050]|nr:sulfite exporter TauE/SafE family protein [Aetokthonos hydrillicola CCALA 1050]
MSNLSAVKFTKVNILEFSLLVWLSSLTAGFLGSLTGLGGGVVIVPLLTVVFGVDIRYAIGASLVSVIATSSGAASAYVKEGYTNMHLGMFLEVATTFGAIVGAIVAGMVSNRAIAIVFGVVLLYSAYVSRQHRVEHLDNEPPDRLATVLQLNGSYPTPDGEKSYNVRAVPVGFGLMFVAGILSGLLGIGSGAVKVLAMDQAMRIPFKVSTTTSNFMIGVTAAASAGVYLKRGYIDPGLAMPVMLGVLLGALLGARVLVRARIGLLRIIFSLVILALAIEMIYKGLTGGI